MAKAGKHTIKLDIGKPKKNGIVTIKFRITNAAGGNPSKIEASFQVTANDTAEQKAKKAKDAIAREIAALIPANRGVAVAQAKVTFAGGKEILLPTIFLRNEQGFGIEKFDYDSGKTKEKARAKAFDSSEPDENASNEPNEARSDEASLRYYGSPSKGIAKLQVGEHPEISVNTDGLSLTQLHQACAAQLEEIGVPVALADGALAEDVEGGTEGPELRFGGDLSLSLSAEADDDELGYRLVLMVSEEKPRKA